MGTPRVALRPAAGPEHEFEAERGLPEPLPAGERLLWQGAPDWRALARHAFHVRALTAYFALLLAAHGAVRLAEGDTAGQAAVSTALLLPLAVAALGMVLLLAWLSSRTAVYTLTDRRVVMRVGIVLTVTFNFPLRCIDAAGLRKLHGGTGDIALALGPGTRIAWLQLWPHARPWRLARTEPTLRAVPDAERVAALLVQAWQQARGQAGAGLPPSLRTPPRAEPAPRATAPLPETCSAFEAHAVACASQPALALRWGAA